MKEFQRVQSVDLTLDSFDPISDFPACGGIGIFRERYVTITMVVL